MNKLSNKSGIFVIYNPNSTGDSKQRGRELVSKLKKSGLDCLLVPTKRAGHAEELAYKYAAKYTKPIIISSSGDGGYNEVVNGIMKAKNEGHDAVAAVLPAGNANDHARVMQDGEFVEKVIKGKTTRIDVLKITVSSESDTVRYAHSYAGIGLTAVAATELNTKNLNPINEKIVVLKKLIKYRPFVIIRGGKKQKLDSLIFANINEMAKILKLSKHNTPRDGKFEVVSFPYQHKFALFKQLVWSTVSSLEPRSFSKYQFKTPKKMVMQLDGEILNIPAGSNVEVACDKQALRTII